VVFNARRRGWDAKGLDLNQDAIDLGSAHCPGLICAKVEDQGFEPDSFDAIVMWHTLEHIEFPESFLQEILRILKPGGQYLLEVPNVSSPIAWLFYRRRWLGFETPQHYYAYQKSTLLPLLERSGLEPLQVWQPVIAGRFPGGWKGFLRSTLFGTLARMSWGDGLRVLARKPS
jgi:SAM-dependent methyltransferase